LLAVYQPASVVPFTLLVPIVGMGTAWLVLAEVPSLAEVLGAIILLAGVATAIARPRRMNDDGPPAMITGPANRLISTGRTAVRPTEGAP